MLSPKVGLWGQAAFRAGVPESPHFGTRSVFPNSRKIPPGRLLLPGGLGTPRNAWQWHARNLAGRDAGRLSWLMITAQLKVGARGEIAWETLASRSPFRHGFQPARRTAFRAEVANMVDRDVEEAGALATGSTADPRAPDLITGCWLGIAHHFFGAGVHDCISVQPSTVQTYAKSSPVGSTTING